MYRFILPLKYSIYYFTDCKFLDDISNKIFLIKIHTAYHK